MSQQDLEAGGLGVQGHLLLHSDFGGPSWATCKAVLKKKKIPEGSDAVRDADMVGKIQTESSAVSVPHILGTQAEPGCFAST